MTRLSALRTLVTAQRDHPDQGRIGRRVLHAQADPVKVRIVRSGLKRLDYIRNAWRTVA